MKPRDLSSVEEKRSQIFPVSQLVACARQSLVPMGFARGLTLVPHVRPASADKAHPRAAVLELDDAKGLARAMSGCTTVIQLIGTMRKRFAQGDTYESSDIGTTRQLTVAARAVTRCRSS